MKNPGKSIRRTYLTALSSLTYNSAPVTIYDQLPILTLPDNYVYINSITYSQIGNNNAFIFDASVTLDINCKQYKKMNYDVVDDIAANMLGVLLQFPYTTVDDVDFQFIAPQVESAQYLLDDDGSYHIIRKIIRIQQTLIQK